MSSRTCGFESRLGYFSAGFAGASACILPLLSPAEYRQFLESVTNQGPFENEDAWKIVYASWSNDFTLSSHGRHDPLDVRQADHYQELSKLLPKWDEERNRFMREEREREERWEPEYRARPRVDEALHLFHWHPPLAPALIPSLLGNSPSESAILNVIGYFRPVADHYQELSKLLPKWEEERNRFMREEREREERSAQERRARQREAEEESARRVAEIESLGLVDALKKIIADWPSSSDLFLSSWLTVSSKELDSLPESLVADLDRTCREHPRDPWMTLLRQIRRAQLYAKRSAEREDELRGLDEFPVVQRLEVIDWSNWPLTYYPENWAAEALE